MRTTSKMIAALAIGLTVSLAQSQGATVPFTEHFAGSVSDWADASGLSLLTYVPSGGPDGSSYASTDFVFAGAGGGVAGNSVVLFRGQDELSSRGIPASTITRAPQRSSLCPCCRAFGRRWHSTLTRVSRSLSLSRDRTLTPCFQTSV